MADRSNAAALAAALAQQFREQFTPSTQTTSDVIARTTGAVGATPNQFGLTQAQLEAAMAPSLTSYQAIDQANAYTPVRNDTWALTNYQNAGDLSPTADRAKEILAQYTDSQISALTNPTNILQNAQRGSTFTNPDDQRPYMTFNDLSMLNPMINNTMETYNAQPSTETPYSMVSDGTSSNIIPFPSQSTANASVIDSLGDLQNTAAIQALTTARDRSLNALNQQEAEIAPQYSNARSQARALSSRSGQSFQQMLANKGINISGQSALGETMRTGALQGQIGALNQAELQALNDIASRRADVNIAYEGDVAASRAQALENQQAQEREDYLATIGRFSNNFQQEINNVTNDNDPTNDWQIPFLEAARQNKIATLNLDPNTGLPLPTSSVVEITPSSALQLWEILGSANESVSNALGIPVGTPFGTPFRTGSGTQSTGYTSDQYAQYVNSRDSILRAYPGNPQRMMDYVLGQAQQLTSTLGSQLYNQLVSDVNSAMGNATSYTEQQYSQYRTLRDSLMAQYANNPQGMIDYVLGQASRLTSNLGNQLYNQLVSDVNSAMSNTHSFSLDDYYNTIKAMQEEVRIIPTIGNQVITEPVYTNGEIKDYVLNLNLTQDETAELFNRLGIPNPY